MAKADVIQMVDGKYPEGTIVFDSKSGEVMRYEHKLDQDRIPQLKTPTPRQVDALKASGKLITKV